MFQREPIQTDAGCGAQIAEELEENFFVPQIIRHPRYKRCYYGYENKRQRGHITDQRSPGNFPTKNRDLFNARRPEQQSVKKRENRGGYDQAVH